MIQQALIYQFNFASSSQLLSSFKFGILDATNAAIYFFDDMGC